MVTGDKEDMLVDRTLVMEAVTESSLKGGSNGLETVRENSSERLVRFLEENNLHKKDFSEMIGVTLSYVYSLIKSEIPFPSRITTLERISVVMGVEPESFPEYHPQEEPRAVDTGIEFLKHRQGILGLTHVQFLKRFQRQQRLDIVDMWRGALPLPLDWAALMTIANVLEIKKDEIYPYWQSRMQQYLSAGGLDPLSNIQLLQGMFQGVKGALKIL